MLLPHADQAARRKKHWMRLVNACDAGREGELILSLYRSGFFVLRKRKNRSSDCGLQSMTRPRFVKVLNLRDDVSMRRWRMPRYAARSRLLVGIMAAGHDRVQFKDRRFHLKPLAGGKRRLCDPVER